MKPRRRQPVVTPRFAEPCTYQADPTAPAAKGEDPPCICHLPRQHARHTPPDTHDEQAAHRARIGDDQ